MEDKTKDEKRKTKLSNLVGIINLQLTWCSIKIKKASDDSENEVAC